MRGGNGRLSVPGGHVARAIGGVGRLAAVVPMVVLAALTLCAPASAEPEGIFGVFRRCPTRVPGVALCAFGRITSGEFVIGSVRVPIAEALTLQVGFKPTGNPENEREFSGVPGTDGESLSNTELNVPGDELLGMAVTATPELVPSAKNQIVFNERAFAEEEEAGLTLPIRLHLNNPILGDSCYIGSAANPLQLRLTDGETHPPEGVEALRGMKGKLKTLEEREELTLRVTGDSLVDNTFSVPGAEGCGESPKGSRDALVDEELEIPSKAGDNAAVLGADLDLAPSYSVLNSESWPVVPEFALPVPGGLPASNVTQLAATLNGTLNPGGAPDDYHFEYGTTTEYGSFEPIPENYTPSTSETLMVSQPVAGLQAGATYHYRLVAENPEGLRVVGPDETFTTLPIPAATVETGGTRAAGVLKATPIGGIAPTASTPPVASSTPPAHHILKARRPVKKHKRTRKHTKHVVHTNARTRKKHANSHRR